MVESAAQTVLVSLVGVDVAVFVDSASQIVLVSLVTADVAAFAEATSQIVLIQLAATDTIPTGVVDETGLVQDLIVVLVLVDAWRQSESAAPGFVIKVPQGRGLSVGG